jgi:hypothetical protein
VAADRRALSTLGKRGCCLHLAHSKEGELAMEASGVSNFSALRRALCFSLATALGCLLGSQLSAQTVTTGVIAAVGGVSIDAKGVLRNAERDETNRLRQVIAQALEPLPGDINQLAMRKVSLARLDRAIRQYVDHGKPLPDAMKYLAGLQQIDYVLVYPEQHDIVLVGPGEGWKIDGRGNLVGAGTGRPVMLLDDLLVALRTAPQTLQTGISCSIDPTPEGIARLHQFIPRLHTIGPDPQATIAAIAEQLGPQRISFTGVPPTSHFARVMISADYRMKRLAMDFEPVPVRGLPSFMSMLRGTSRGMGAMAPRWWLAPDYQPLLRDAEGLAWQLRGAAVKTMTEEDYLSANGSRQHTGKVNPLAQKWADLMTLKYAELSVADPIFGQLRNCMELAIVAALVVEERLPEKAGANLATLLDSGRLEVDRFPAPQQVDTQARALKRGSNWIISASGGVLIQPGLALQKAVQNEAAAKLRSTAGPVQGDRWWWN